MAKAKPPLEITSVFRTRKTIRLAWNQGEASFDLEETENPLPSFLKALEALTPLVATICHFPAKYAETDCRVCGLIIGSKGGADTIVLDVRKGLDDAAKEFKFKTPERLLKHPEEEGTYTPPLTDEEAALVYTMIEEAKQYIRGERAQGVLPVLGETEEGEDADDPDQGKLIDITGAQDPKPKKAKAEPAAAK